MHPPRRLCSLLGGVFLIFFCFFYVADHYDYRYYVRTAVGTQDYDGQLSQEDDSLRLTALGHVLLNDTTDSSHHWSVGHDRRSARDKKKRQCKKKYAKCNKLSTDPEPPLEVFEDRRSEAEDNLTRSESMEDPPLWSQFADRGYTVVGKLTVCCSSLQLVANWTVYNV